MYFSVFLLIFSFNHLSLVNSDNGNSTENGECSLCTISFFRRKRALSEYTRWRSNPETTQEFIIKVSEDDITMPQTKQVVAVNIKPNRKEEEKIIVGATLLSTPVSITTLADEYTRFVPPTTLKLTRYEDIVLAPVTSSIPPIKPKSKVRKGEQHIGPIIKFSGDRYALRDESPPSGPKFIPRTNTEFQSQYAPIAPVVFSQKTTFGPLTPRTVEKFVMYKTTVRPSRTSQFLDAITPVRTPDFLNIRGLVDNKRKSFLFSPTHSSIYPNDTTAMITFIDDNDDLFKTNGDDAHRRKYNDEKKSTEKDADEFYHNLMMYDDDTDVTTRKVYHSFTDIYEDASDKSRLHETTSSTNSLSTDLEEYDNTTEKMDYRDDDDLQKGTTSKTVTTRNTEEFSLRATTFAKESENNTRRACNLLKLRQLSFSSPRTLFEITTQLKQWAEESPVAKWVDITNGNYTVMENPIYMMIVDDPSSGQIMSAKQTVMIVAGIQGRDHHAVAAAMYVLYQLIERTDAHSDLLVKYRFWIIPVFNPDGYDYSMTFPRRREWTKNLRQNWDSCKGRDTCEACEQYGIMCTIQPCYGVNLDRNFEYQWIPPEELRSEHPCGTLYAGPRQLSEAETRALTHFLHEQKIPLYTFIALKEGEVLGVMYPYSHTRKRRAFDHVYRQRASLAAAAAFSISGRPYTAGQTSEFLPLYAGGIEDWVDGHLGIDNTYTVMVFRPSDSYNSKILTERVVHEAFAAVDTLLLQSTGPLGPPPVTLSRSIAVELKPTFKTFIILCIHVKLFRKS